MKSFELKSGTNLTIDDSKIIIERTNGKSAAKGLFAGRTMGMMTIRLSSVSGIIHFADWLVICGSGLPTPKEFKISSISDIKQYPNCIVGKQDELKEIYDYLTQLI